MQNEAVDYLTGSYQPSPYIQMLRTMLPKGAYMSQDNPDLRLGKEVVKDYAGQRMLDRLSLGERRLESSLYRTITEFFRWRPMRRAEGRAEEPTPKAEETACKTNPISQGQGTDGAEQTPLTGVKTQETGVSGEA
jgi:hypothetical protein